METEQLARDIAQTLQGATLREPVFKQVAAACGSHDLAACLSDDAGLILETALAGVSSAWVDALRGCYAAHRLPEGALDARRRHGDGMPPSPKRKV